MNLELKIGDVLLLPLIMAIVEGAKTVGMPVEWARWLTGLLAVLFYGLMMVYNAMPEYQTYITALITVIGLFLGTTGLYTFTKSAMQRVK